MERLMRYRPTRAELTATSCIVESVDGIRGRRAREIVSLSPVKVCLGCDHRFAASDWRCPECGWTPDAHNGWPLFAPDLSKQNDGFDAAAFAKLAAFEPRHFWFRARNRLLIWSLQKYFPDAHRLLEIGCGTAYVLTGMHHALPSLELMGSEALNDGLSFARSRLGDVPLLQMDARRIPFDAHFDVVGAFDVLEHIDEDETVLSEMFRAVKPGGGIILTVPQHRFLWSVVDEYSHHKRRYRRRELVGKVQRAGFRVVRATSFVSALLPLFWLSRLRHNGREFDPDSEFKISRALNGILERVLDVERRLITSGISLPYGTSLLVVATRPS
jgi:SAM-dependent methyltransferase